MHKELIAAYQMFLVPTTILFTALGIATTEGLKTGISAIGVMLSVVWALTLFIWQSPALTRGERIVALMMPLIFLIVAIISLGHHGCEFLKGAGFNLKAFWTL